MRRVSGPLARLALFVVFFWFGILKVFFVSSADVLVNSLLAQTLPFVSYEHFFVFLGIWEMAIGLAFLIPGLERVAIALLLPHMITTFMPLFLLKSVSWQNFPVPTLEGQYIIKNIVIVAAALGIAAHLHPNHKLKD